MNLKEPSPCRKDCPERNAECHAHCGRYIKWSTARNAELERVQKIKAGGRDYRDYVEKNVRRATRGKGKRI